LFFTIDYKLPSSGECVKMQDGNYFALTSGDVLKFVVGSPGDVSAMVALVERIQARVETGSALMPQIFIGAVAAPDGEYGMDLPTLAENIIKYKGKMCAH
jgi:hypothetical protein